MQFHEDGPAAGHRIAGYGEGYFVIGDTRYEGSVVLSATALVEDWRPQSVETLRTEDLSVVDELDPEVVLIGTGREHRFPAAAALASLYERGIGVEIMSTGAACRTFNILVAEGRRVAALLMVVR